MTLLTQQLAAISDVTAAERSQRLAEAGTTWNERIARDAGNAQLTYRVTGRGVGSVGTEIRAGKHRFLVDEPGALAGDDAAASPVEYALGALISCQIVVFRLYAEALGLTIDDIEIEAEGDLDVRKLFGIDESGRAGFHDVRVRVDITGPDSAEQYEKLRTVVEERCPVLDLFANTVPVSGRLS
ncbi:OsmC family protein [Microbacterium esteraromaticum]|uniref:OsmC family protein n=1 Tax=Microbacterium esteraromaticum TaxID=57043 RepID=A0A939IUV5_9MICO|nr:OsmC family protein [Microbacterium esteraromaticum]MBN7793335.1 OsmC family protein [Microbacterium esteraromaticum]MBN8205404.1 OsmC family protein [Microbacterium esteraromaticum]MBN8415558.1 OsmC family protein [Microbacterium esteraromaticum]MBN8424096.1 OsmC family protein [Microbacterium esteraromaticum]